MTQREACLARGNLSKVVLQDAHCGLAVLSRWAITNGSFPIRNGEIGLEGRRRVQLGADVSDLDVIREDRGPFDQDAPGLGAQLAHSGAELYTHQAW